MCVIHILILVYLQFLLAVPRVITEAPHETLPHPERIINGKEAYIYDHPFLVYLGMAATNELICGGTILNRWSILTAAHCVHKRDIDEIQVVAGYNKEARHMQYRDLYLVTIHPKYIDRTKNNMTVKLIDYDYAVAQMDEPLKYTLAIQSVTLGTTMANIQSDTELRALGWGEIQPKRTVKAFEHHFRRLKTPQLKGVILKLVDVEECQKNYSEIRVTITRRFFCAASMEGDTCQGDSGGPLLVGNVQYGVVSFAAGCFRWGFPSVFAKIPPVYDWIMATAGVAQFTVECLFYCLFISICTCLK